MTLQNICGMSIPDHTDARSSNCRGRWPRSLPVVGRPGSSSSKYLGTFFLEMDCNIFPAELENRCEETVPGSILDHGWIWAIFLFPSNVTRT